MAVYFTPTKPLLPNAAVLIPGPISKAPKRPLRLISVTSGGALLSGTDDGIAFNKHFDGDGEIIFRHACSLGCEGIVSKRINGRYEPNRRSWLNVNIGWRHFSRRGSKT